MPRRYNKMLISEAFEIFGFDSNSEITKKTIMKRFRKLSLLNHPDKGGDGKVFAKIVKAKEILLQDFDTIATTTFDKDGKPIKSVGSVFIDWLKVADTKNIKNPFTVYQQGKTRRKK